MPSISSRIATGINQFNLFIGNMASWLSLALVIAVFTVVILRYVFNYGNIALQEVSMYLMAMLFLLSCASTYIQNGHVRVDLFYKDRSKKQQALTDLLGTLFLMLPTLFTIFYYSVSYVARSWSVMEGSQEAGGLNLVYLLKTLIPVFTFLLFLQSIAIIIEKIQVLRIDEKEQV